MFYLIEICVLLGQEVLRCTSISDKLRQLNPFAKNDGGILGSNGDIRFVQVAKESSNVFLLTLSNQMLLRQWDMAGAVCVATDNIGLLTNDAELSSSREAGLF